jgi:hypothetical protein
VCFISLIKLVSLITLSENVFSGQELNHKTYIHTFIVLLNHVLSYIHPQQPITCGSTPCIKL